MTGLKKTKTALIILIIFFAAIVLAGMYKFNYLASLPNHDVDGNKIEVDRT